MTPESRTNPRTNRRPTAALLLGCSLLLTACQRQSQGPVATPPPEVATLTVARQRVVLTTELPGRTVPYRIAEIRPQVNGLIQKRLFTEGAEVQVDQELYQVDPAPFQAALESAEASLGRSEANLPAIRSRVSRYQDALRDNAVSQQDYDDAAAALKQAEADLLYWKAMIRTARINLGYARVVSPISGRVGRSSVTDGAIVTAYQPLPLATIQQLDPIYVDVPQSATEVLRLQRCLEEGSLRHNGTNLVRLILADGTAYPLEGSLQFRDVSVDPTTGSQILRMVFPNPNRVLLPGMFVRAVLTEGINEQAILIPQQSVSRDPKGTPLALLVESSGKVVQRVLSLDRAVGDQWLVTAGLNPGDQVIAEGMQKVRPGMPVRVVPFGAAKTSGGSQPAQPNATAK